MAEPSNLLLFPQEEGKAWILEYQSACLTHKDEATVDAYMRILRQFTQWVANRPGHSRHFDVSQNTFRFSLREPLLDIFGVPACLAEEFLMW